MRFSRTAHAIVVTLVGMGLVGCAMPSSKTDVSPPGDGTRLRLATSFSATVLDDGSGPQLCVGGIMESYPPQCGGPALVSGWDWADWEGHYESASGVHWGEFWVAGFYDPAADTFRVEEARPADADADAASDYDPIDFSSPCPVPEGGWRVLDPDRTTQEAQDATLTHAAGMPGYAGAWVDQSVNPAFGTVVEDEGDQFDIDMSMNDPMQLILNVSTTGDIARVERELRGLWGGMLCVSSAPGEKTEAELQAIVEEITGERERVLASGVNTMTGTVSVFVIFDDGSIQDELDARYGEGIVTVDSALVPWP